MGNLRRRTGATRLVGTVLVTGLIASGLAACGGDEEGGGPHTPSYAAAASTPRVDSVYPGTGNAAIDVRHYAVDLTWDPRTRAMKAVETITLRGTKRAERFSLDLDEGIRISATDVDGAPADPERDGTRIIVPGHVGPGHDTVVRIEYAGQPSGVAAPSGIDFDRIGWHVNGAGEVTSVQRPYGAYTWYAVNDTPSDKAFHDITLRVPEKWVGISSGTLASRTVEDGRTVTQWHGSAPAAPSAIALVIGDYVSGKSELGKGTPVLTWWHRGDTKARRALTNVPTIVDWLVSRLGAYPFDSVGAVAIPRGKPSPTQETVMLDAADLSDTTLIDQLAHQWIGNAVTPVDWRGLWLAEGIPFLLANGDWKVEHGTPWGTVRAVLDEADAWQRPPGGLAGYAPTDFGADRVGPGAALLWYAVRQQMGAKEYEQMLRHLTGEFAGESIGRSDLLTWLKRDFNVDATPTFAAWLDATRSR